jgi:uncharacterized protein HemY
MLDNIKAALAASHHHDPDDADSWLRWLVGRYELQQQNADLARVQIEMQKEKIADLREALAEMRERNAGKN